MNAEVVALIGALIVAVSEGWRWLTTWQHRRIERARAEVWHRHCQYKQMMNESVYPQYVRGEQDAFSFGLNDLLGGTLSMVHAAMNQQRDRELEAVTMRKSLAATVTEEHSCGEPPRYQTREQEYRRQRAHHTVTVIGGGVVALGAALALVQ